MHGERILIVDDNPANLLLLKKLIGRVLDHEVLEASSGETALELAQASPGLALILLDVHMAAVSGIDVCRILKHNPRTRSIPIILISAVHTDDGSIAEGLEAGADGYLTKPINENMLHAWLKATLRINALNQALADNGGHESGDMEALTTMFSHLSHNVNNPLQAIMASGDLLDMEHENDESVRQAVQIIQENAEKIAQLVGEASRHAKAYQSSPARD